MPYYLFQEDAAKVINLIYDHGWFVGNRISRERALACPWDHGVRLDEMNHGFWVAYPTMGGDHTRVNSPAHLIAYCRTLGLRGPLVNE